MRPGTVFDPLRYVMVKEDKGPYKLIGKAVSYIKSLQTDKRGGSGGVLFYDTYSIYKARIEYVQIKSKGDIFIENVYSDNASTYPMNDCKVYDSNNEERWFESDGIK